MQVALRRGGICGSDLHYFNHGGFGTVRLREPMILGHEVAGEITEIGPQVTGLAVGDLVAISPSRPCFTCVECRRGLPNQCLNMRFYGSAMPFPHIQGAFREVITVRAENCVKADG
ncbi:MAG: alcohol dehydrogenase catalytic domain-containing protein, partial [Paracoccaceae bacterium]